MWSKRDVAQAMLLVLLMIAVVSYVDRFVP
jgi:hypothetical protein